MLVSNHPWHWSLIASRYRVTVSALWIMPMICLLACWPAPGHCQERPKFNPHKALDKPVRPIVNPNIVAAGKTAEPMRNDELVLGVVVNGQARAYPINMLTGPMREIINDRLGERDIAATW